MKEIEGWLTWQESGGKGKIRNLRVEVPQELQGKWLDLLVRLENRMERVLTDLRVSRVCLTVRSASGVTALLSSSPLAAVSGWTLPTAIRTSPMSSRSVFSEVLTPSTS